MHGFTLSDGEIESDINMGNEYCQIQTFRKSTILKHRLLHNCLPECLSHFAMVAFDVMTFINPHYKETSQRIAGAPSHYEKFYLVAYACNERCVSTKRQRTCLCCLSLYEKYALLSCVQIECECESKNFLMFTFYSFSPTFAWCK